MGARFSIGRVVLTGFILTAALTAVVARPRSDPEAIRTAVTRLAAPTPRERRAAFTDLQSSRIVEVLELLRVARTKKPRYEEDDERTLAIRMLGEHRYGGAAETLVNPQGGIIAIYPCVEALVRLGEPAVLQIVHQVETTPTKEALRLHCYVLQAADRSYNVPELRIRNALRQDDGKRRKYLKALQSAYRNNRFWSDFEASGSRPPTGVLHAGRTPSRTARLLRAATRHSRF